MKNCNKCQIAINGNSNYFKLCNKTRNKSTTWTWNIDHIIPHSTFKYISMEDQSFKECWSLTNLRPYSAKQNILDKDNRFNKEG
jgi:hypothetical protein